MDERGIETMAAQPQTGYRVLARKYRPSSFADLIGQDAMIRTLRNAFSSNRLAHAYMLTGVRGIGKTTTARILARAFNYESKEGDSAPSLDMPELGVHCQAILDSRHMDVIEMDAASHTGIDDVRDIIDSATYRPVAARYKVFIIDEVHMLSRQAFNGLLKTLEEPPDHVKFIFATTEIRKVPITVLSRCQRFDLRRIPGAMMVEHLAGIAEKEGVKAEEEALAQIARAAEGSVRDALSILDQAIAHGGGNVVGQTVRDMLGVADRGRTLDLFEAAMTGDVAGALTIFDDMHAVGADPLAIIDDLAEAAHLATRFKLVPDLGSDQALSEDEKTRGANFAEMLPVSALSRAWQVLLKGHDEVESAPRPAHAAEMVLVRLAYMATLPSPEEALRKLEEGAGDMPSVPAGNPSTDGGARAYSPSQPRGGARPQTQPDMQTDPVQAVSQPEVTLRTFADVVALAESKRDIKLKMELERFVRPVSISGRSIDIALVPGAPVSLVQDLGRRLQEWTGERWLVSISKEDGETTLRDQREQEEAARLKRLKEHPAVAAVLEQYPDAAITIRDLHETEPEGLADPEAETESNQED